MSKTKKTKNTEITYSPRKLARSVAKANMKKAGATRINRNFALNWRNWVTR